jgi:adenosylhomocysteine nucleosidase
MDFKGLPLTGSRGRAPGLPSPVFITGLAAEARLLRPLGLPVLIGGGTAEGAARCAAAAIASGASALISFGLAGGLDPALPAGTLICPRQILWHGTVLKTDATLTAQLGGATCDTLLADEEISATTTDKYALWSGTHAAAIDMESGAVAAAAAQEGLPFAVLRAICDPATRSLPQAALIALDKTGRIGFLAVMASVLRNPAQIPRLLALANDAAQARKTLIAQVKYLASHDHPAPLVLSQNVP